MSTIKESGIKGRQKADYEGQNAIDWHYQETVKTPLVEPHCNCPECYEYNGNAMTATIMGFYAKPKLTKLNKDKETCYFCGHYVLWEVEGTGRNAFRNNKRGKYKLKEKTL
tara:strand:+ start:168 stop:500 length:333 start_codon:yes stop_codon:yes gene_type:complete